MPRCPADTAQRCPDECDPEIRPGKERSKIASKIWYQKRHLHVLAVGHLWCPEYERGLLARLPLRHLVERKAELDLEVFVRCCARFGTLRA